MAAINLDTATATPSHGPHEVYTRAAWADVWTLQPGLQAVESVWSCAPAPSTAALVWRYGRQLLPGATASVDLSPLDIRGQFVRIRWTADDASLIDWIGYVESIDDEPQGAASGAIPSSGQQTLHCLGMEQALAVQPIVDTVWQKDAAAVRGGGPTTFNAGGLGNRSADAIAGVYTFTRDREAGEKWSTKQIVEHLLTYQLPTGSGGVSTIPWALVGGSNLPDYDHPEVECEGRSVADLLNRLIGPRGMLGWTVTSDGTTMGVNVFTYVSADLDIGSGRTIPANPNSHTLTALSDPLSDPRFYEMPGGWDQVLVRGARRVSIATLSVGTQMDENWSASTKTNYDAAASGETGYGDLNQSEQRTLNVQARTQPLYDDLYTSFKVAADWDMQVDLQPVFVDDALADASAEVNPAALELMPEEIPLREALAIWPPLLTIELPPLPLGQGPAPNGALEEPRIELNKTGLAAVPNNPHVPHDVTVAFDIVDNRLELDVEGAPRHAIAYGTFTPLPVDNRDHGQLDYKTLQVSIGIRENRYCEAAWPTTTPTADVVRRKVVYVGDAYQQVWIAQGTVTHLDADGRPVKTAEGAYRFDDTAALESLAKTIGTWYVATRSRLSLVTRRRLSAISIGDIITTANGRSVNAPVTAIRIQSPADNDRGQPPKQVFQTFQGQLDPLSVLL